MKKIQKDLLFNLLALSAVILYGQSCIEEGPKVYENSVVSLTPTSLSLSRKSISFQTFEESSQEVMVSSVNVDWEFTDIPSWIRITPSKGKKGDTRVTVTCEKNTSLEGRVGIITFRSQGDWNYSTKFTVSQTRNEYQAIPETGSVELPWVPSQTVINVNANNDSWTVSTNVTEWLSITKSSNTILIDCKENDTESSRKGLITVSTLDQVHTITVTQNAREADVSSDSTMLWFSDLEGTAYIYVNTSANAHWTAGTMDDWITISPTQGKGNGTIQVSVPENTKGPVRDGSVTVTVSEYTSVMPVHQDGKYLQVSSPALSFGSHGGKKQLSIKTNDGWTASTDCKWLVLSDSVGDQDCDIMLTVHDNNTISERKGNVIITPKYANPLMLNISQAGRYLNISDTCVVFNGTASRIIKVDTDGEYKVTTDCKWLNVKQEQGSLTLTMSDLNIEGPVTDTVTVSLEGLDSGKLSRKIVVTFNSVNLSYVDLGLSVKWAVCNVGALSASEYGNYYAWGESDTYYDGTFNDGWSVTWKSGRDKGYSWDSYTYCNRSYVSTYYSIDGILTKYCLTSNYGDGGFVDYKQVLDPEDDAAHAQWGGDWRMPTPDEFVELFNTDDFVWTWTTIDGVDGYSVTGKKEGYTDRSIFFPAGGYIDDLNRMSLNYVGRYWSGSLSSISYTSQILIIENTINGKNYNLSTMSRDAGCLIRPVCTYNESELKEIMIDSTSLTLVKGGQYTLSVKGIKKDDKPGSVNVSWISSNDSVAVVSNGTVKAVGGGSCVISAVLGSLTASCSVTVFDVDAMEHEYVDLGLSVKWATCNVGAYSPEGYGDYYAWGETEPYYEVGQAQYDKPNWRQGKTSGYEWASYKYCQGYGRNFTKYCFDSSYGLAGYVDDLTILEPGDDVANVRWKGNWRMPTVDEFDELLRSDKCTRKWTTLNGVYGYLITSNVPGYTDQSVFLPAAGERMEQQHYFDGKSGAYWTSSFYTESSSKSNGSALGKNVEENGSWTSIVYRQYGLSVRPVLPFITSDYIGITLDFSNIYLTPSDEMDVVVSYLKQDSTLMSCNDSVIWSTSCDTIATVVNGTIKGINYGNCVIKATVGPFSANCSVSVINPTEFEAQFESVDLGLSVKWATFNVGSFRPDVAGDYYAWGETEPYYEPGQGQSADPIWKSNKTTGYSLKSYSLRDGQNYFTKYNSTDNKTVLDLIDDVANARLGDNWRMPTKDEFEELMSSDNCTWEFIQYQGKTPGFIVTSKRPGYTDKSIFLPTGGGYYSGTSRYYSTNNKYGRYWTSTLDPYYEAYYYRPDYGNIYSDERYYGYYVRPVCTYVESELTDIRIDSTELKLGLGDSFQLSTIGVKPTGDLGSVVVVWSSSNDSVASVSDGLIKAKSVGSCTITASLGALSAICTLTVFDPDAIEHEYVDLGLSVKWATVNVGAYKPEMYGDYYAWGETEPYYKPGEARSDNPNWIDGKSSGYNWNSYVYCNGNSNSLKKYCLNSSYGTLDNKRVLEKEDDVARVKWGGDWRMPTIDEIKELRDSCKWEWITNNGVKGYLVTSRLSGYTDRSIFIPASGYRYDTAISSVGSNGYYWSSSVCNDNGGKTAYYGFINYYSNYVSSNNRSAGYTVRPVCGYNDNELDRIEIDTTSLSLVLGTEYELKVNGFKEDNSPVFVDVTWSSSNDSIATVIDGVVKAISGGSCTITATLGSLTSSCTVVVVDPYSIEHEFVDLGLSVKWATLNVGACSLDLYGDYFAWGETEPYYETRQTKTDTRTWKSGKSLGYDWPSYKYCNGSSSSLTKYFSNSNYGIVDNKQVLDPEDDVAHVKWGGSWRIPSNEEYRELLNSENCSWTWTMENGIAGYRVTSKKAGYTDRSIFLPAARYFSGTNYYSYSGNKGYYWSNLRLTGDYYNSEAFYLSFSSSNTGSTSSMPRCYGASVRPVCTFDDAELEEIKLDSARLDLVLGWQYQLTTAGYRNDGSPVLVDVSWSSSNNTVATVTNGMVKAVGGGSCTVTATLGSLTANCTVTVIDPDAINHESVDLGLSVKWATINVGACSLDPYGDYYAWGETETYYEAGQGHFSEPVWRSGKATGYRYSSYFDTNDGGSTFIRYNDSGKKVILPEDDVANVRWGGDWRMPTKAEFDELYNSSNCSWTWTSQDGVQGYLVTSKISGYEGNSIFLPAAGYRDGTNIYQVVDNRGYYWSSSLYDDSRGWRLHFYSNYKTISDQKRYSGFSIRPVCLYGASELKEIELNFSQLKLALGGKSEIKATGVKNDNSLAQVTKSVEWSSSDESVAKVTGDLVVAVGAGSCTITASLGSLSATCSVTVLDPGSVIPECVDLGLSVKWATFNVGAYSEEMYGDYYAWGAIEPYYESGQAQLSGISWNSGKESGYSWSSYDYCNGSSSAITKYCYSGDYGYGGYTDSRMILDMEDDVAHVKWGGDWRMPTSEEFDELSNEDNFTWTWTAQNGIKGYRVTSKKAGYTDKSIFLPAAGYRSGRDLYNISSHGYYWSGSLNTVNYPYNANGLSYQYGNKSSTKMDRSYGQSVRPVCPYDADDLSEIAVNKDELKLAVGGKGELNVSGIKANGSTAKISSTMAWTSSDESVAIVADGIITAIGAGSCTVTATYGSHTDDCEVTVVDLSTVTPEYVDLGLNVKWATFNIGAFSPEMYGDYFAWGATEPYYEDGNALLSDPSWKSEKPGGYIWSSYDYCSGNKNTMTKYCRYSNYGTVDNMILLEAIDDVAHVKWGGDWRMPTIDDFEELFESSNCSWTWTTVNGINGYRVTSKKTGYTDRSIFLPAAGYRTYKSNNSVGLYGRYWSSSLYQSDSNLGFSYGFGFSSNSYGYDSRFTGLTIRPVCPFVVDDIAEIRLDHSTFELVPGESGTLSATVYKTDGYPVRYTDLEWYSNDESVATVSNGTIVAVSAGTCLITVTDSVHEASCTLSVIDPYDVEFEYVDLGLSVKWAKFNLGAYKPEMFGDYYAWGETEPYYEPGQSKLYSAMWKSGKTAGYAWADYAYCRGSNSTITKYCDNGGYGNNGYSDSKVVLDPEDDAAHVKWKGEWRIPTLDEFNELHNSNNCTWSWVSRNGVEGYLVTSIKEGFEGSSIFLPAAGYRSGTSCNVSSIGYYWSSSLGTDYPYNGCCLYFFNGWESFPKNNRCLGYSIRPVCP